MMELPPSLPNKSKKPTVKPAKSCPAHPYVEKEKELVSFFAGLGFNTTDGFYCGGWDAINKKGKESTILLQEGSVIIVQPDRLPHAIDLPQHLKLPAKELLHTEHPRAAQTLCRK